MTETVKVLIGRRSVRQFKAEQIREEQLQEILEAGRYAPSGMGRQPVKMIVIQDKDTIAQLSKMNARIMGGGKDPFYGAPTVIVVVAERSVPTHYADGCLTMGNLMNAAHAVGVDSCWIHRAKEEFDSEEGKALLKTWGIEGDYEGIGHCILGYHEGAYPVAAKRKDDSVVRV